MQCIEPGKQLQKQGSHLAESSKIFELQLQPVKKSKADATVVKSTITMVELKESNILSGTLFFLLFS